MTATPTRRAVLLGIGAATAAGAAGAALGRAVGASSPGVPPAPAALPAVGASQIETVSFVLPRWGASSLLEIDDIVSVVCDGRRSLWKITNLSSTADRDLIVEGYRAGDTILEEVINAV